MSDHELRAQISQLWARINALETQVRLILASIDSHSEALTHAANSIDIIRQELEDRAQSRKGRKK